MQAGDEGQFYTDEHFSQTKRNRSKQESRPSQRKAAGLFDEYRGKVPPSLKRGDSPTAAGAQASMLGASWVDERVEASRRVHHDPESVREYVALECSGEVRLS